jgi:nitroreductase
MDVFEAIEKRRAYRFLDPVEISQELIVSLAKCASPALSCFNDQPWRFIFVVDSEKLHEIFSTLSKNNDWFTDASMVIAVFTKKDLDCIMKNGREDSFLIQEWLQAFSFFEQLKLDLLLIQLQVTKRRKQKKFLKYSG